LSSPAKFDRLSVVKFGGTCPKKHTGLRYGKHTELRNAYGEGSPGLGCESLQPAAMVYGTFLEKAPGVSGLPLRGVVVGVGSLVICCVVASVGILSTSQLQLRAGLEQRQPQELLQKLAQTSVRTDIVHPYGSLYPAEQKFINPSGARRQAVNPAPNYPYHKGVRPHAVLNDDFEHEPFGNHLPWEHAPEGALAKYKEDPDM
jgi:hypothetical protein